jgi:4-hydroxybenzoate polyprenyltransferase
MITLQAVALFVFGYAAGGGSGTVLPGLVAIALFGAASQGLCSVLNDITDIEVDRINHPERPLASGKVAVNAAWLVVGTCFAGVVVCGLAVAALPVSFVALAGHLLLSIAYSFPGVRLGRHWLFGPLALAGATCCGIVFVLSCTALFQSGGAGQQASVLIAAVCLMCHLLVIPLKDLKDVRGDASAGGSSLAMRLPRWAISSLAVAGYVAPWVLLYFGAQMFGLPTEFPRVALAFQALAILFWAIGLVVSGAITLRPRLLMTSQRFVWFAELGVLFLFLVTLPVGLLAFMSS